VSFYLIEGAYRLYSGTGKGRREGSKGSIRLWLDSQVSTGSKEAMNRTKPQEL
jgi:hypothetical protein